MKLSHWQPEGKVPFNIILGLCQNQEETHPGYIPNRENYGLVALNDQLYSTEKL